MKKVIICLIAIAAAIAVPVLGQEGETWETQESVWNVTLIRILPNMDDVYLNNLKKTWVTGMKATMEEGLITDFKILQTITGNGAGYNLMLITEHPNLAALDATDAWRAKLDAIGAKVEAMISDEAADEITSTVYPEVREILSENYVREIKYID